MTVFNIVIIIILSCGTWFSMTAFHELGHVTALIITKYLLCREYKHKLNIKILIAFCNGHTDSYLYAYLIKNEKYRLLKLNAVFGYTLEISYSVCMITFMPYTTLPIASITMSITYAIGLFLILGSITKGGDFKVLLHPESFKYNNKIVNRGLLKPFDYLPLLVSTCASVITYLVIHYMR